MRGGNRKDISDQISAIRRQEKRDGNTEFTEIGTQRAQRKEKNEEVKEHTSARVQE